MEQLWNVDPEDSVFTYTGEPEVTELDEERLSTFQREIWNND